MRATWGLILFLAFYTALAQPGLPACWLEREPCRIHPHFNGQPDRPHTHDDLFDLSQTSGVAALPLAAAPAALLLAWLGRVLVWWKTAGDAAAGQRWSVLIDPPPPR